MKRRDLEKHLRQHGCELDHHGSRHDVWHNPESGKQTAVPRGNEILTHTAEGICKDLDMPKPGKR